MRIKLRPKDLSQMKHNQQTRSYPLQLVPSRRTRLAGRVFQLLSRWRKCWTSHPHRRRFCRWAFDHRAGFRVPSSKAPSKRFQSGHRLGRHESRGTRAERRGKQCNVNIQCRKRATLYDMQIKLWWKTERTDLKTSLIWELALENLE